MSQRCCKQILNAGMWSSYHQCSRKSVVERDGKHYCKIHDPVLRSEKQAATHAKWSEEMEKKQRAFDRTKAMQSACEGLTTAQLEQLGIGGVAKLLRDRDALLVALKRITWIDKTLSPFEVREIANAAIAQSEASK